MTGSLETRTEALLAALSAAGLKRTEQRKILIEELLTLGRSATLEELLARAREKRSKVGFSTVYRTMKALHEAGLAREIRFADGLARYEIGPADEDRAHFVCSSCGLVAEIPTARLEKAMASVRRLVRGRVDRVRIEAGGLCAECVKDLPAARRGK